MAAVTTHKFVSAVGDGGDATLVRPSNWNDEHSITDLTGTYEVTNAESIQLLEVALTGTDRVTLVGTARMYIFGWTDTRVYNIVGFPFRPTAPFRIPAGYANRWMGRLILDQAVRAVVEGDGEMKLFDDLGPSRLVLTGRG
jgi:hypothetical protein